MIKKIIARVYQLTFFLTAVLMPVLSFAADKENTKNAGVPEYVPPSWSSYMLAYMLVVLCVGLALMVTCAPINRRDKPLQKD